MPCLIKWLNITLPDLFQVFQKEFCEKLVEVLANNVRAPEVSGIESHDQFKAILVDFLDYFSLKLKGTRGELSSLISSHNLGQLLKWTIPRLAVKKDYLIKLMFICLLKRGGGGDGKRESGKSSPKCSLKTYLVDILLFIFYDMDRQDMDEGSLTKLLFHVLNHLT